MDLSPQKVMLVGVLAIASCVIYLKASNRSQVEARRFDKETAKIIAVAPALPEAPTPTPTPATGPRASPEPSG